MKFIYSTLISILFVIYSSAGLAAEFQYVSPDKGGPRNWQVLSTTDTVTMYEGMDIGAVQVKNLAPGDVLDNLDCKIAEEQQWCYVQPLGGGPVGYVLANHLQPAKAKDGTIGYGTDDSSLRAGQKQFDATGKIPCAKYAGQPMTQCDFSVARAGSGYATVVVHWPNQTDRVFYFRMGMAIGVASSEAERVGEFSATYSQDLHQISVGVERYEIPDAVIFGG